jgi:WD40 repeat protein
MHDIQKNAFSYFFYCSLYCGYEDAIHVFDFQTPGEGTKLATTPSKKSKDGMKGIVSSIAFSPDYSGLFAASSLSGAITLFSEATGEDPIAYLDGMTGAITQVNRTLFCIDRQPC